MDCSQCYAYDRLNSGSGTKLDEGRVHGAYIRDCNEFGYFDASVLAYLFTTRSSMPESTGADASNSDCGSVCGVLRTQSRDCRPTPLDSKSLPPRGSVESLGVDYYGSLLLNRTAAKCMCTLPVLRRFSGCRWCIASRKSDDSVQIVNDYEVDYISLGYWTD